MGATVSTAPTTGRLAARPDGRGVTAVGCAAVRCPGPPAALRPRKAADELLRRRHPRHRGGAHRVPPGLQHRPPDDRREDARPPGRRPGRHRLHRGDPDGRDRGGDPLLRPRHLADRPGLGASAWSSRSTAASSTTGWAGTSSSARSRSASSACCSRTSSRTTCAPCGWWPSALIALERGDVVRRAAWPRQDRGEQRPDPARRDRGRPRPVRRADPRRLPLRAPRSRRACSAGSTG